MGRASACFCMLASRTLQPALGMRGGPDCEVLCAVEWSEAGPEPGKAAQQAVGAGSVVPFAMDWAAATRAKALASVSNLCAPPVLYRVCCKAYLFGML